MALEDLEIIVARIAVEAMKFPRIIGVQSGFCLKIKTSHNSYASSDLLKAQVAQISETLASATSIQRL
jgi:hypothetical protein